MSLRIGIGKLRMTPSLALADPAIAVINDGNTIGWYLADDLMTITKDGGNLVSRWNDKLGSGHDLIQAVAGNQPLWVSPDYIEFDGIDNYMSTVTFTWNQPAMIYLIVKQVSWTANDVIFSPYTNTIYLIQRTASPKIAANAGSYSSDSSDLAVGAWGIVRLLFYGANSKLIINNNTPITGNFGANVPAGVTVGARLTSLFSNIQVKEIICRKIADTASNEALIYNYLVTRMP